MGIITALEPQKKKKNRVNIFVDGEFAVGLSQDIVFKNRLKAGKEISSQQLEQLVKENELDKILLKVYRFLSYRPRSEKEIRDYLAKKKTSVLLTALVIKTLEKQKYLDDKEFASWWVDQRMQFRPVGEWVLKAELLQKGISKKIIEEMVNGQWSIVNSQDLALKAAKKKLRRYKGLDQIEFRRKMGNFLARRGFDWETIKEVTEKISTHKPEQSSV